MNPDPTVYTIIPYKLNVQWMFDDERFGLVGEPFAFGSDRLMSRFSFVHADGADRFRLTMSSPPLPVNHEELTFQKGNYELGCIYETLQRFGCWLCPALKFYYPENPPKKIYMAAEPL